MNIHFFMMIVKAMKMSTHKRNKKWAFSCFLVAKQGDTRIIIYFLAKLVSFVIVLILSVIVVGTYKVTRKNNFSLTLA